MSRRPFDRSPKLKQLRDDGYDIDVVTGYLLVRDVPYVNAKRQVKRGVLISALEVNNDVALPPQDHQAKWFSEHPCNEDGTPIQGLGSSKQPLRIADIEAKWNFSCQPKPADRYREIGRAHV